MKIHIENISFAEYVDHKDKRDFDYYIRFGKFEPVDKLDIGPFDSSDFGFVKDCQDALNYGGMTWEIYFGILSSKLNKSIADIVSLPLFDLHQTRLYIRSQVEMINKIEADNLGHQATSEEERAGIDMFKKYRAFCQFDKLMTCWPQYTLAEIRALPYSFCFTKLMYEADKNEFDRRLRDIYNQKNR